MHNYVTETLSKNASPKRHKVAIVGARGYSGAELARLLLKHPEAELVGCFANSATFQLSQLLPESQAAQVATWTMNEYENRLSDLDTIFLATPAEASAELAQTALKASVNVIDLSGAFRLKQGSQSECLEKYLRWYAMRHPAVELLLQAEYGLQPWSAPTKTKGARLIANPGCYATAILMGTLPLLKNNLILPESLVIDAKSGTSGGGRKASEGLLFTEVEGECLPYKVARHQHWPEIVEAAAAFAWTRISPFFTTHLLNVRRGIIASMYARLAPSVIGADDKQTETRLQAVFAEAYAGYSLVRFGALGTPETDSLLSLKRVVGSARTQIAFRVEGDKLFLFSLIDNLVKGAAGQAVENLNRLLDRPVDLGLSGMEGVL